MIADMALSTGDTLIYDSSTPGGSTLQMHCNNSATLSKIAQGNWDFVILQAQSQEPSFSPAQVATDVLPYAHQLDSLIHAADTCVETLFYMTWGRKNGDASNCSFYPPVCTFSGMQERLRQSYILMAQQNNASIAPVGSVWREVRNLNPSFDLYQPDESHPSVWGSYIAACTFYKIMFTKNISASSYHASLPAQDAQLIQNTAEAFFADSLQTYIQNGSVPFPEFSYTVSNGTVIFNNTSINCDNYYWTFGNDSISLSENPLINYDAPGTYTVQLHGYNGCMENVFTDTITIHSTALATSDIKSVYVCYSSGKTIYAEPDEDCELLLINSSGVVILKRNLIRNCRYRFDEEIAEGIYLAILKSEKEVLTKKLLIRR